MAVAVLLSSQCHAAAKRKIVTVLRHGQSMHNVRAEAARHGGCSFERFLELMALDDAFDAPLTELGIQQVSKSKRKAEA